MNIANKVKLKIFLLFTLTFAFSIVSVKSFSQKVKTDSLSKAKKIKDTTITVVKEDTINLKFSKDTLDGSISYNAQDSMVYDVSAKKIRLYGKETKTNYKENELSAPLIELDQETGNIIASIKRDSTGKVIALPTFKQADFTSQSDSIKFNLKTGKGLTKSTYTQQGEMYVYGEVIKKTSPDVFFVKRGRITTCDLDTPHFAFVSNRFKFISKKLAITGPIHPEFEGVPIPIYLPFGIFPLNQGRHSGLLAPSFAANEQLGIGLENGGYYKILGPYWDVIMRGNIYSYGGWTGIINPRYSRKYRYNGAINLAVQHFVYNHKGDPDYQKNQNFNLTWNHSMDSKARPGVSFSANVNAGSSSFNRYVPNSPYKNFQNQLSSSIVYAKTWKDKPFKLTISANHNQNTNLKLVNVNLPDVGFNVNTIYPFRKTAVIGTPKWYENIGFGYTGEAKSLFSFYDTATHILKHIKDTFQYGAHHSIPLSISLPQIGAFQIAPAISYDETWYQRKIFRRWNSANNKVDTSYQRGFYTARQMNFGINASTRIFGMFNSTKKDAQIVAVRHEIRPTIGLAYHPDMNSKSWVLTQIDSFHHKIPLSIYDGNIFSPYGYGKSGGISFGIDNTLQMKVRNRKDTGENSIKKVSLIDGFSINGFYNLLADSFKLSNFSLSARSTLFDKINITANAQIDPYQVNQQGQRINTYVLQKNPFSLGRITNGNVSISSSFQGGGKKDTNKKTPLKSNDYPLTQGYSPDEQMNELNYIRNNPAEYTDFNIPWSVNFSYSLRFDKVFNYTGFRTEFEQDVTFGGTLNLTPKWQLGINGFYNLTERKLGTLALSISREMHCWQLGINISPIGQYRFFSINLSPKSGLLRDLRINRTRSFYEGL
ncbi:MAG: putative LPS assembly protein LptD [Ginsengibacter sp.]